MKRRVQVWQKNHNAATKDAFFFIFQNRYTVKLSKKKDFNKTAFTDFIKRGNE